MKLVRPPWLPIDKYVDMIDRGKLTEREALAAGRSVIRDHPEFVTGLIDIYVREEISAQQRLRPSVPAEPPVRAEPQPAVSPAPEARQAPAPVAVPKPQPRQPTDQELTLELFPSLPYRVPVAVGKPRLVLTLTGHQLDMMENILVNQYTHAMEDGMTKAGAKWEKKISEVRGFHAVMRPLLHGDETVDDVIKRVGFTRIQELLSARDSYRS